MRRLKKIMAAVLAGALIVGSVGVVPVVDIKATEETNISHVTKADIVCKYDFDAQISIATSGATAAMQALSGYAAQTISGEEGYVYLEGAPSGSNPYLFFNFRNDNSTTGILWMSMELTALQIDAAVTIRIVGDNANAGAANEHADVASGLVLEQDKKHIISCKVDLDNDKYYMYLDGTELNTGTYKGQQFNRFRVLLTGNDSYTTDTPGLKFDNVAVYKSENWVDVFETPTKLVLDGSDVALENVGDSKQLTVGVDTGIVPDITWTSDNEGVATVSSTGLVTAKKVGLTTITANAGNLEAICNVSVGVEDLLFLQDFDNDTQLGENGLGFKSDKADSIFVPTDSTSILKKNDTDGTNKYLYLTAGTSENRVNLHFPNDYTDGVLWIEMHVSKTGEPWKILTYGSGTSNYNAQTSLLGVIYGSQIKATDSPPAQTYGSVKEDEWVKLSYKITLGTVPGTCEVYVNDEFQYNLNYAAVGPNSKNPLNTCQMLSIVVAANSGADPTTTGIKIDDIAVYRNSEQIDYFAPEIKQMNLSLDGNVGVNLYADINSRLAESKNAFMKLTLPNNDSEEKQIYFSGKTKEDNGYYKFTGEVSVKDMTGDIGVDMYEGDRKLINSEKCSVYGYAQKILSNDEYADAVPLVKALLNYGGYAQKYFDVRTEALANESLTTEEQTVSDVTVQMIGGAITKGNTEGHSDAITFYGPSLDLKSQTALNFYFKSTDEAMKTLTFSIGGTEITPEKVGSMYCVKKADISAVDLKTLYTVNVTQGDSDELTVSYSALQYAYDVLSATKDITGKGDDKMDALRNVVRALYKYQMAAETYQNQQSGS